MNDLFVRNINILIKPTNECFLKCCYCYNSVQQTVSEKKVMDLEDHEKLLKMLCETYLKVKFVWIGGEPLLYGKDKFEDVFRLQKKYMQDYNLKILNVIQTNGLLLDDEYLRLFDKYGVGIGISYDGKMSDLTRGYGKQTFDLIQKLNEQERGCGIIEVISNKNVNSICEDYETYNRLGINVKFNRIFSSVTDDIAAQYCISTEKYIESMKKLFELWIKDDSCRISAEPMESYAKLYLLEKNTSCQFGTCLFKYLTMDAKGNIYFCSKSLPGEEIGNIKEYDSIVDVFEHDKYEKIIESTMNRKKDCLDRCKYYYYCGGGCNFKHSHNYSEEEFCEDFKQIFSYVIEYIENNKELIRNPKVKLMLEGRNV